MLQPSVKFKKVGPRKPPQALWKAYVQACAVAFFAALILRAFVIQAYRIPSGSMEDTVSSIKDMDYFIRSTNQNVRSSISCCITYSHMEGVTSCIDTRSVVCITTKVNPLYKDICWTIPKNSNLCIRKCWFEVRDIEITWNEVNDIVDCTYL